VKEVRKKELDCVHIGGGEFALRGLMVYWDLTEVQTWKAEVRGQPPILRHSSVL
jgi:hypothetical protein